MINSHTKFIIIIGDPIAHSLSPLVHNSAFQSADLDEKFVYLASHAKVEDIGTITRTMRSMENFHGLTCTVPHKVAVMDYLDEIDEIARKIGAVNTVVKENGRLKGYNTDWLGIVTSLQQKVTRLRNKKVLIIGAGGAARAAVFGMLQEKCQVTIMNRSANRASILAQEFGCEVLPVPTPSSISPFDIIINTTPLGMHPHQKESPLPEGMIHRNHIVFDIVYTPKETVFVKQAYKVGAEVVYGWEMFLHQATAQFEQYTGHKAPRKVMQQIIEQSYAK